MLIAWVVFPAVLTLLAVGCGLLVKALARDMPRALVPGVGLAVMVVVGQYTTLSDAAAELTTPLIVGLAAAGVGLALPIRRWAVGQAAWALGTALAVFAVYAAPIVLSGEATFAGYILLDDTATWMALTDRVMEHGRSLDGLAPSTYEATLAFNLADGYPIGVFIPLGAGQQLVGEDVAWLVQPYMAWLGAVLALGLWSLARPLIGAPGPRSAVAFIAAQPALLFGYYLWGGIKELAAAALLATLAGLLASAATRSFSLRELTAVGVVAGAMVGVLSVGGGLWLAPPLLLAGAVALRRLPLAWVGARALLLTLLIAVCSLPVIATGGLLPPTSSPLTDPAAQGNLIGPLNPLQVAGVWPAGDFRVDPDDRSFAIALICVIGAGAAAGVWLAWRRRAIWIVGYVAGLLVSCGAIWVIGSPWVEGKALATASPAIPFACALFAGWLVGNRRRIEGIALATALVGGIVWSNALAYRDASLAPRDQLAELERIGDDFAGQGPTLMTEYQPYGARHFLRNADAEGVSELRRRRIPLISGETVEKGAAADTDALDPNSLLEYRTLVLRRSPTQSRPPAAYRLRWAGRYYEVWQRNPAVSAAPVRLPLGGALEPTDVPTCSDVLALTEEAPDGATLVGARRSEATIVALGSLRLPGGWIASSTPTEVVPETPGSMVTGVDLSRAGSYDFWLGGSIRPEVVLSVNGREVGRVRHHLNNDGQYLDLGSAELEEGRHGLIIEVASPGLRPGEGGAATAVGPLVATRSLAADARLIEVPVTRAAELCGRRWDWIELHP